MGAREWSAPCTLVTVNDVRPDAAAGAVGLQFLGHSTVLVDLDGVRVLTDPFLRGSIGPLRRHGRPVDADARSVDAVVISHAHRDHLDVPSLRRLHGQPLILVPAGLGSIVARAGYRQVAEVRAGDVARIGSLTIDVFPARHDGYRPPLGPRAEAVGFVFRGAASAVYFAGDTDLFPEMEQLTDTMDVALLPVWGWGPYLGSGHLDPGRAAVAARLIRARYTVPIHWGSLYPRGFHHLWPDRLYRPPRDFAQLVADLGGGTDVRILEPGDRAEVAPMATSTDSRLMR